jgi:hypothetical protein
VARAARSGAFRISAEQTSLWTVARPGVPGKTACAQAMTTGYSAWPAAGSASESGTASTLGQTAAAMTRPGHSDACANELSTRAGEKGVHERVNDCGSEGFGSLLAGGAGRGAGRGKALQGISAGEDTHACGTMVRVMLSQRRR